MLRILKENDLPALTSIENMTQLSPWSDDIFTKCLNAGAKGWVIELSNQVIGFILILSQVGECHILNLSIHPDYQHEGYGKMLLQHTLDQLKAEKVGTVYLEVRRSNVHAISLYTQKGFKKIGERLNYYILPTGREDALTFAKDLQAD